MEIEKETIDTGVLKRRLNHELESIKVMLVHKKRDLPTEEWLGFVEVTRKSILIHPDQYLEKNIPTKEILETIVNKIFEDFLISSHRISNTNLNADTPS